VIHIKCPKCGDYLSLPIERIGQSETCPNCGNITIVPDVFSNPKHITPEEKKHVFLFGLAGKYDPAESGWVLGAMAIGAIIGALIGAPRIDPENPIIGVFFGGLFGLILGMLIGGAYYYLSKSKK
jgi:hypothetical protein